MDFKQFKPLVEGKSFADEESQKELFKQINAQLDGAFEKYKANEQDLNAKLKSAESSNQELTNQVAKMQANIDSINQRMYIAKNISADLDDESVNDLMALARSKVDSNTSMEQALVNTAKKYNFIKSATQPVVEAPKPVETVQVEPQPVAKKVGTPSNVPQASNGQKDPFTEYREKCQSTLAKYGYRVK